MKSDAKESSKLEVMATGNDMNAEVPSELRELINKREAARSTIEEMFDLDFLADLRGRPAHFVYELLQNAEDAGAQKVCFKLTENGLDMHHNGDPFDIEDVKGITSVGKSRKKNDPDQIGRFGLGFKSVFAITSTPRVFSGKYNIEIEDLCFLKPLPVSKSKNSGTLIQLPFNYDELGEDKAFEIVSGELEGLDPKTLLFLTNIKEIKWEIKGTEGSYTRCSEELEDIQTEKPLNVERVQLYSTHHDTSCYVMFGRLTDEKNLRVKVAFKLSESDGGKEQIVPESNSKLVAFFPTGMDTSLDFVIHGPYDTNPSRADIKEITNHAINRKITEEIGELIAESLPIIKKDLGLLDVAFLSLLPITSPKNSDRNPDVFYSILYKRVKEELSSGEFLPTANGDYTTSRNAVLADSGGLIEFLDGDDLNQLFSRTNSDWLDQGIVRDRSIVNYKRVQLWNYLAGRDKLDVKVVDFRIFASKITEEFLQGKSDKWMADFYSRLLDQKALWDRSGDQSLTLNTGPIIRLEQDSETGEHEHIAPFNEDGRRQVYLPTKPKSDYKTVKDCFVLDGETESEIPRELVAKSQEFLIDGLGIKEPDIHTRVEEKILPWYIEEETFERFMSRRRLDDYGNDDYVDEFMTILKSYELYDKTSPDKKKLLKDTLSKTRFLTARKNESGGELHMVSPTEVYLENPDLDKFFEGEDSVYFWGTAVFDTDGDDFDRGRINKFLKDLGAETVPRINESPRPLTEEEQDDVRVQEHSHRGKILAGEILDYEYEGLDNFLKRGISFERSCLLWKLLVRSFGKLEGGQAEVQAKARERLWAGLRYMWWKKDELTEHNWVPTKILDSLGNHIWWFDENENAKELSEITFSELHENYERTGEGVKLLKDLFRSDKSLAERLAQVMEEEDLTFEQAMERLKRPEETTDKVKKEKTWAPQCEPEEAEFVVEEIEFNDPLPDAPVEPEENGTIDIPKPPEDPHTPEKEDDIPPVDRKYKKDIGRWGEKRVYISLQKGYEKEYKENCKIIPKDMGFEVLVSDDRKIKVVWHNKGDKDTGIGHDICIRQDDEEVKYIEVKSTTQANPRTIEVQETQWSWAKKHGKNYSFYVVSDAGCRVGKIRPLDDPYRRWKEGWLQAHPVRLKLPKNTQDG